MPDDYDDLRQRVANLEGLFIDLTAALKNYGKRNAERALKLDLQQAPFVAEVPAIGSDFTVLRDQLVERFEKVTGKKYVFDGAKDAAAVKRLLALKFELREELLSRWEECITTRGFPGTHSLAVFATRVNSFGSAQRSAVGSAIGPTPSGDPYAP